MPDIKNLNSFLYPSLERFALTNQYEDSDIANELFAVFRDFARSLDVDGITYYAVEGGIVVSKIMYDHSMGDEAWDWAHAQTKNIKVGDPNSIVGTFAGLPNLELNPEVANNVRGRFSWNHFTTLWHIPYLEDLSDDLRTRVRAVDSKKYLANSMVLLKQDYPPRHRVKILQLIREYSAPRLPGNQNSFEEREIGLIAVAMKLVFQILQSHEKNAHLLSISKQIEKAVLE